MNAKKAYALSVFAQLLLTAEIHDSSIARSSSATWTARLLVGVLVLNRAFSRYTSSGRFERAQEGTFDGQIGRELATKGTNCDAIPYAVRLD